jgi:hypothetical protein
LSSRHFVRRRFVCAPSSQPLFWVSLYEENMPLFPSRIIKSCRCNPTARWFFAWTCVCMGCKVWACIAWACAVWACTAFACMACAFTAGRVWRLQECQGLGRHGFPDWGRAVRMVKMLKHYNVNVPLMLKRRYISLRVHGKTVQESYEIVNADIFRKH